MNTRVLVCGDRNWNDKAFIKAILQTMHASPPGIEAVIEGEASGADTQAKEAAEELRILVMKFPADWTKYHRAAGPIRNKQMLDEGKPGIVLAFHDSIETSKGTKNMIAQAKLRGIKIMLLSHKEVKQ